MKLLRCHIENFGKITDFDINFADGINVINEPNAWGKSTLASYIKAIFYGVDKERKTYMPWQGGVYGGTLDFAAGDRNYRVSRTFGKTAKGDEFHIYNLDTKLESVDFTEKLGEELFDLDANSFMRSIFIAQNDCTSTTSDGINAKLGNLVENTNDINNYETAKTELKNLLNSMSPTRVTGSIKKRKNEITSLKVDLKGYDAAKNSIDELNKRLYQTIQNKNELSEKRNSLAVDLKEASKESTKNEQRRNYLALCEEQQARLEVLVPYTDLFPHGVPKEGEIADVIKDSRSLEEKTNSLKRYELSDSEREEFEKLSKMFEDNKTPDEDQIDEYIKELVRLAPLKTDREKVLLQLDEKEKETKLAGDEPKEDRKAFRGYNVVGGVLAIVGVACEIAGIGFNNLFNYGYLIAGVGALVLIVGLVFVLVGIHKKTNLLSKQREDKKQWLLASKDRKETVAKLLEKEKKLNTEIRVISMRIKEFLEEYHVYCEVSDFDSKLYELKSQSKDFLRLLKMKEAHDSLNEEIKAIKQEILSYGRRVGWKFNEDITADLTYLQNEVTKYNMAKAAADAAMEKVKEFESRTDMEELLSDNDRSYNLEEINDEIRELDERIEGVRNNISSYNRQLDDMQQQLDLLDEKKDELAELEEIQKADEDKYEILSLTDEYLTKAREQFIARYMAPISNGFKHYYDILINGTDDTEWLIDANISYKRRELGQLRDTAALSSGYKDLIGVCMRLALVEAMYQTERPFLVFDDPFVNLDDEKTIQGMDLLNEVAKDYQMIYFTCHTAREPK